MKQNRTLLRSNMPGTMHIDFFEVEIESTSRMAMDFPAAFAVVLPKATKDQLAKGKLFAAFFACELSMLR